MNKNVFFTDYEVFPLGVLRILGMITSPAAALSTGPDQAKRPDFERASSSEGEESGEEEEDDEPVAGPSGGTKGRGRTSTKKSKLYKANKSKLN